MYIEIVGTDEAVGTEIGSCRKSLCTYDIISYIESFMHAKSCASGDGMATQERVREIEREEERDRKREREKGDGNASARERQRQRQRQKEDGASARG